ncbi:MAG TPA: plastocyanin/azurin family copper-binding protein [Thermomicrobiales bacterium]
MRRRMLSCAAVLVALTALAAPAMAGGWASVRLDGPPPPPFQEVPWTVGFTVKQHDVTPINVERALLEATHKTTGETVRADAVQEGEVGHFSVTVTFPTAGDWKWSITPEPFEGTAFPTLHVLTGPNDTSNEANAASAPGPQPVHIHDGTCAALGDVVFPLNDVGSGMMSDGTPVAAGAFVGAQSAVPVAISVTTVDATLASLADGNHAINVHKSATEIGTYVACGDIGGQPAGDQLVVGLEPLNDSGETGVAVLQGAGAQTTVTLYLLVVQAPTGTPTASTGATAEVKLVGGTDGAWQFEPSYLEVETGTTVTWTNETEVAHTVSGANLAFEDSGYIEPGQSFSQAFTQPGTYSYRCDPHPWMTGTVVVM